MKQDATKQQEAEARAKSLRDDLIYNTVPGMVRLLEGDVVQLDGGPHIVTRSDQSGATVQPLQKKHVKRETLGGKKVEFWAKQRVQHISGCVPKYLILERRGDAGLQEFLGGKNLPNRQTPPAAGQSETGGGNQTTESSEVMAAKKNKKTPATPAAQQSKAKTANVSYAGRRQFVDGLVAAGKSEAEIKSAVEAKYPGSNPARVARMIARGKRKQQAEAKGKDAAK